ncbi:MAG: hypothetical protein KDI30_08240 [Pseudomonadales bacterium]|nr:hypothetical protein [Pseudomonadales bacterium]
MSEDTQESKISRKLNSAKEQLSSAMIHHAHKNRDYSQQETRFNITFSGDYLIEQETAIANVSALMKQGKETTRRLLQKGMILKNFDNKSAAERFLKLTRTAGIDCRIDIEQLGEEIDAGLLEKAAHKLDELSVPQIHVPRPSQMTTRQRISYGLPVLMVIAIALYFLLAPPVIEGNSFASYSQSVEKVLKHADDTKRASLKKAIDLLTGAGFEYHKKNTSGANEEVASGMVYSQIKGMNAKQIMATAEEYLEKKRRWFREAISEAETNIALINREIGEVEKQNSVLQDFTISENRYEWRTGGEPNALLKFTNNSPHVISRVFFEGKLYDGDTLLASNPFSYGVAVGLQPGRYTYVTLFSRDNDNPWAIEAAKDRNIRFEVDIAYAEDTRGEQIGIDIRPLLKKKADEQQRKKRLEEQLRAIHL